MNVHIHQGHRPDLKQAEVYVVIDVIRAFTTAWIAFARGVREILLVREIDEAFALRRHYPDYLLVGERKALKIEGFDLGNSPWEMSRADVARRGLIFTTTNGVTATLHALAQCAPSGAVFATGYLGAAQTVAAIETLATGRRDLRVNLIASHPTGDEDLACAEWMRARLHGEDADEAAVVARILASEAAAKFLDPARPEYDARDMDLVTGARAEPLALRATMRDDRPVLLPVSTTLASP
jgi:2-phosphosulfolactate phosphatase